MGSMPDWPRVVTALRSLPRIEAVEEDTWLRRLSEWRLQGTGLGFVDVHLLVAAHGEPEMRIWTRDKRLAAAAATLNLCHDPK
jgi:hypothetical protein